MAAYRSHVDILQYLTNICRAANNCYVNFMVPVVDTDIAWLMEG